MYRKKAAQCLKEGKRNEARECFQRCLECTPKMALEVIKVQVSYKKKYRLYKLKKSQLINIQNLFIKIIYI